MAKEFKQFDKMFTKAQIEKKRAQYLNIGGYSHIKFWEYRDSIETHTNERIRECVYEIYDAEEWQLFRVSLKGLTTQQKLRMLEVRYQTWVALQETEVACVEKCRIDNYIGALVRGGQLAVGTYEVQK